MQRGLQIQEKLDFFKNDLYLQVGLHSYEKAPFFGRKNADACQGDSGGPVVWRNPKSGRYEQVVIASKIL